MKLRRDCVYLTGLLSVNAVLYHVIFKIFRENPFLLLVACHKDLRNTTEISEICRLSKEPIFITKNGYGDMVIMSMETYERSFAKLEIYQKLAEAEAQITNGEVLLDGEEVFKRLRAKHDKK